MKMYKEKAIRFSALLMIMVMITALLLTGCGGSGSSSGSDDAVKTVDLADCQDGTFEGRSEDHEADEDGNGSGYGVAVVEIKDHEILSCEFTMYELDGTVKDETYGADLSQENRLKAQKAVQSGAKYSEMLVSSGSLDGVDTITGATISHSEFLEAVSDALSKAAE